jgi:hypothetical protein
MINSSNSISSQFQLHFKPYNFNNPQLFSFDLHHPLNACQCIFQLNLSGYKQKQQRNFYCILQATMKTLGKALNKSQREAVQLLISPKKGENSSE